MLRTLDRQSILLDPTTFAEMRTAPSRNMAGVGLVLVRRRDESVLVSQVLPDGGGARAGLRAGDRLLYVDQRDVAPLKLGEVIEALRGEPGTNVELRLERDGAPGAIAVTAVRTALRPVTIAPAPRVLQAPAASGRPATKVGYFHLRRFASNALT